MCIRDSYEAKGRLYELARQLRHRGFIQISKSTVINAAMVAFVEVEFLSLIHIYTMDWSICLSDLWRITWNGSMETA